MSTDFWDLRDFAAAGQEARMGRSSRLLTLMLVVLVALVACGIGWAHWARIEQVTRGEGRVVPSGRARTVENLEGGTVREILVREGDAVRAGEVLVRISDVGASANLGELRAQQQAMAARNLRLEAEARGDQALDFTGTEVDPQSPQALREAALFVSRQASYQAQRQVLEAAQDLGLSLNLGKSELVVLADDEPEGLSERFPAALLQDPETRQSRVLTKGNFEFLGAPLGDGDYAAQHTRKRVAKAQATMQRRSDQPALKITKRLSVARDRENARAVLRRLVER